MSTKITDLAAKLNIPLKELKEKITKLGFELSPKARVIDDETATLIFDEFKKEKEEVAEVEKRPEDIAEIYDEIIAEKQEREIVKSQRKQTAGKDAGKAKREQAREMPVAPIKDMI
ncbi:MAG: translation initiation factor IF-2 N-terminal domain-containing protein [Patescibacteria group bacterium]